MNKEQQDKLWNDLPEEYKSCYSVKYKRAKGLLKNDPNNFTAQEVIRAIEPLFGTHNLNPEPQIKTWKDVEKYYKDKGISTDYGVIFECGLGEGIINKMIATAKISKLIELGYGGMVSEEEWKDESIPKECIVPVSPKGFEYTTCRYYSDKAYIAFHSIEQLVEFMSHESNKKLVEMYYLM